MKAKVETFLDRLLFGDVDARPAAAMRIFAALCTIWSLAARFELAESAYSRAGWLPVALARSYLPGTWSLFFVIDSPLGVRIGLTLGIVAAIFLCLGRFTRASTIVTFVIVASLHARNPILVFGGDSLIRLMLLSLLFARAGEVWSIDALLRKRADYRARIGSGDLRRMAVSPSRPVPVWPLRLMQFQLALMYFQTGLVKCYGPAWRSGDALWFVLSNPLYSRFLPSGATLPRIFVPLLRWATWITLAWELSFCLLVWSRWTRTFTLVVGVGLHLGVMLTLCVQWFTPAVLTAYLAFVPGRSLRGLELVFVRRFRQRLRVDAPRIVFDRTSRSLDTVAWLLALDHFRVLEFESGGAGVQVLDRRGRVLAGRSAFRAVAAVCPALAMLLPIVMIPGLGDRVIRAWKRRR